MDASSPNRFFVLAEEVRRHDRDRFALILLAPRAKREALSALYVFDRMLARIAATEPMLLRLRLQWWRDALGTTGTRQAEDVPVLDGLAEAVARHGLPLSGLERLIDAREAMLDDGPPADGAVLEERAESDRLLLDLALTVLGVGDESARQAARHAGTAWGLTARLRSLSTAPPALILQSLAAVPGMNPADAARLVAERASGHLAAARALRDVVPKKAVPVLLTVCLAETYLRRLEKAGYVLSAPGWAETRPQPLRLAWMAWRGRY
ncbi:MAG: squalene/phytoene synthase family protein [Rhodospirillaceae bacterium]|nr:squalene/phytoene synthase family protein [Rhodospirillaceae bacterium]